MHSIYLFWRKKILFFIFNDTVNIIDIKFGGSCINSTTTSQLNIRGLNRRLKKKRLKVDGFKALTITRFVE
jgi:hypothetical protein